MGGMNFLKNWILYIYFFYEESHEIFNKQESNYFFIGNCKCIYNEAWNLVRWKRKWYIDHFDFNSM